MARKTISQFECPIVEVGNCAAHTNGLVHLYLGIYIYMSRYYRSYFAIQKATREIRATRDNEWSMKTCLSYIFAYTSNTSAYELWRRSELFNVARRQGLCGPNSTERKRERARGGLDLIFHKSTECLKIHADDLRTTDRLRSCGKSILYPVFSSVNHDR